LTGPPPKPPGADQELRARLRATYATEVDRLETLIGEDLSPWKR